jgi:hypothetical protein
MWLSALLKTRRDEKMLTTIVNPATPRLAVILLVDNVNKLEANLVVPFVITSDNAEGRHVGSWVRHEK